MIELRRGGLGPYDLAGRVAVIAGGSGGIGSATARRLADAGATVVVGYHQGRQRAAGLAASLPGEGHAALRISVDDTPSVGAAAEAVRGWHGHCDVLVNCAGWTAAVPHADLDALDSAAIEKQAAGTPLRVLVHPDDVAVAIIGTVTHLRVATGTVITVDGGKHL